MADQNLRPATAAGQTSAAKESPSTAAKHQKSVVTQLEEAIQKIRSRVETNQASTQSAITALMEEQRKNQEDNNSQFTTITNTLEQIRSTLATSATQIVVAPPLSSAGSVAFGSLDTTSQVPPVDQSRSGASTSGSSSGPRDFDTGSNSGAIGRQAARKLHDLPTFSGAPEEWPRFYLMYIQSTEAFGYTSLDNCIRLQRCLTGAAKEEVECLLMNVNDMDKVVKALEFRFGRPEFLVQSQLRRVRNFAPISDRNLEQVVPFASKVANMLAYLDQPKTRDHLTSPDLLEKLVMKLPRALLHDWGRHASQLQPCPNIWHFSTWLQEQANSVTHMVPAEVLANASAESESSRTRLNQSTSGNRRDRVMHASTSERSQCEACGLAGHVVERCRQFSQLSVADRWEKAREKRLCFCCLRYGHSTSRCESRTPCSIENCGRSHHSLLHATSNRNPVDRVQRPNVPVDRNPFSRAQPNASAGTGQAQRSMLGGNGAQSGSNGNRERVHNCQPTTPSAARAMYRILPVMLYANGREVQTYALLDEGSSVTIIDSSLARELNLRGPRSTLDLQWFGSHCASEMSQTVALRISGTGSHRRQYYLGNVRTVRHLDLPAQSLAMTDLASRFEYLGGLPVEDYQQAVPKILIGVDNIFLGVATRQISCDPSGPVATRTRLGWMICGPTSSVPNQGGPVVMMHMTDKSELQLNELQQAVKDYFSLESFGVRHMQHELESRDDQRARMMLSNTTTRIGERYETGLLWKHDSVSLPESIGMAKNRLLSVERKMLRDTAYGVQYAAIISDYVVKGYARRLTDEEAAIEDERTWYLPHFAVTNPNKPGKMRVVFDAAATAGGVSLNSVLLKGPDLNRPLLAVLHQFRMGIFGVCGDIKEMFLQVRIRPSDVNSQRFLWRNGDSSQPIGVYVMQAMIFGAACSPCSAQYVKNVNADRYVRDHPDAVRHIKEAHYVDDFVSSFDSEEEAVRVTKMIVDIHKKGGFELRGFLSNSLEVLRAVGAEQTQSAIDLQLDDDKADKILGMYWCTREDAFLFRLTFSRVDPAVVDGSRRPTKREVLSATMSVFDPFGLLANFTIYAKLMLQDLWRHGVGWDEPIPKELDTKWRQWLAKLDVCRQIRVPRCYAAGIATKRVQLHIFADASQSAFATVAYWRIEVSPDRWRLVFVCGKSRCAPPKHLSIPRLELQAAVLAVRLNRSIRSVHGLDVERTVFWTDSKTVVQWVRSDRLLFRPFVAHRIAEILEDSAIEDWRWVPTQLNAADDATRAKYPVRYEARNRWIEGPDFLLRSDADWPREPANMLCSDGAEEVRPHSVDFHRACRAMAMAIRFAKNVRTRTRTTGELHPDELAEAERQLIRVAQEEAFAEEFMALRRGEAVDRRSALRSLMPHLDAHGLMRVTGRIDKAVHLPEDARNPIIMPKSHHLTMILVSSYHRKMRHQQHAAVICEIRQRYWVPHLRVLVKRVKNECMLCRLKAARVIEPVMGQLPPDRLTPYVRPFTYTGLDYFGPLYVTIGRSKVKRWVALFTCMTIRAVHLELATDLSTDACILCLRNFMNLRGVPKRIRSDNGTNFVGASRELREAIDAIDHAELQREFSARRIEWVFNCPSNPEAGGCWERLVQSVKKILAVTMAEQAPKVETLRSLLFEAANIINSRPLTALAVSGDDDEPLTPNHFLLGSTSSTQTPGPDDQRLLCQRKQWRVAQTLKNRFWKRWINEYLPDLTRRAKGFAEHPILAVGSLVLICEPDLARGQWRRGRITQVFPGSDGRIRTAVVKTAEGEFKRPVSKLAVLNVMM